MPRIVDLSQEIYQGMFVYPGHLKTVIWEHHSHEETVKNFEGGFSYQSRGLLMSDHGPTHVDALSHLDPRPEAPSIDKMSLDLFYGDAICIDVSHKEPRTYINAADIDEAAITAQRSISASILAWMNLEVCGWSKRGSRPLASILPARTIPPAVLIRAI